VTVTHRSFSGLAVAIALALSWSATAALAQPSSAPEGRIRIEYVPPKNPDHQKLYAMLQERRALETIRTMFSPFRFPADLVIRTVGCDSANAFYGREGDTPTVTICYEYLQEIMEKMPKETTPAGVTPADAVVGQFIFAVAHEMGHAAFDIFDIPVLGREEDAADQFAAFFMLQFRNDQAHRLIAGAAYAYSEFVKDYRSKPDVTVSLAVFSSDHGLPEQRFANLLCIAYGQDAAVFADVADKEYLPAARAKRCRYEYLILRHAIRRLVAPHIDKDAAQKVLDTQWLTNSETARRER
jgi:hypothetical protein